MNADEEAAFAMVVAALRMLAEPKNFARFVKGVDKMLWRDKGEWTSDLYDTHMTLMGFVGNPNPDMARVVAEILTPDQITVLRALLDRIQSQGQDEEAAMLQRLAREAEGDERF